MQYDLVAGDNTLLEIRCVDSSGNVIDLTGATVQLIWDDVNGNDVVADATVTDAAAGIVQYRFTNGQIYAPSMQIEVKITDGVGNVLRSTQTIDLTVREAVEG